ncbi:unnamed protein product [Caretta caretta]
MKTFLLFNNVCLNILCNHIANISGMRLADVLSVCSNGEKTVQGKVFDFCLPVFQHTNRIPLILTQPELH